MFRNAALVLTLSGLYACVPDPNRDDQTQNTNVTMMGTFLSNGGETEIYFGNSAAPIARTADRGSYKIEVPRALIEQTTDRRLYFYSSLGEAGTSAEIEEFESGRKSLDTVYLSPTVSVEGDILTLDQGLEKPVKEAEIQVGRVKAVSDETGHYQIQLPRYAKLPVEVRKAGFVITKATWKTTAIAEQRPFYMYTNLEPQGHVQIPVQERLLENPDTKVPLYIEGTAGAVYLRVSTAPFTMDAALDKNWLPLKDEVTIKASDLRQARLYYQFADKDKQALSPIVILPLSTP